MVLLVCFKVSLLSYSLRIFLVGLGEGGAIQITPVVVHEAQEAVKVRRWTPCFYSLMTVIFLKNIFIDNHIK